MDGCWWVYLRDGAGGTEEGRQRVEEGRAEGRREMREGREWEGGEDWGGGGAGKSRAKGSADCDTVSQILIQTLVAGHLLAQELAWHADSSILILVETAYTRSDIYWNQHAQWTR